METRRIFCVTGNRPQKLSFGMDESHPDCVALKTRFAKTIEQAVKDGYTHMISGAAQGADQWAMEIAFQLKKQYPHLTVEAAIPCEEQDKQWGAEARERYRRLLSQCDVQTFVQRRHSPDCMMKRNRYMVDQSELVIAVSGGQPGGTRNTIAYAERQGKKLVTLSADGSGL